MLHAWKPGTHKQYSVYIRKWYKFCEQREINCVTPNVSVVIEFLTELFDQGFGYSAINTARSALSQFIVYKGHCTIGSHPFVIKFVKAVFNLRPPVPRYSDIWDVSILLKFLRSLSTLHHLSLKKLTLKVVSLVALHVAARAQTLTCLDLNKMTKSKSKFVFRVGASDLKQSRPGYTPPQVELKAYPVDRRLCVYKALEVYIEQTKHLRNTESRLFLSYMKPHKRVSSSTIGTWIKGVLHPWTLFLKTLCIFSKNKATSEKVSYGSGQKCSKELKNHSFTSVETIVVQLQWKIGKNQYFPCFEP